MGVERVDRGPCRRHLEGEISAAGRSGASGRACRRLAASRTPSRYARRPKRPRCKTSWSSTLHLQNELVRIVYALGGKDAPVPVPEAACREALAVAVDVFEHVVIRLKRAS